MYIFLIKYLNLNKVKFEWTEACEKGFQKFKDKLTSTTVFTLPWVTKEFVMYCDASRVGLDCVFMQHHKVIAYASRQFKVYEELSNS